MEGEVLGDDQWERLREFVPSGRKGKPARAAMGGVCGCAAVAGALGQSLA